MRSLLAVAAVAATVATAAAGGVAPVPGLTTASGPDGSLFGRGYDPVFMKPRGSVVSFSYDNLNGNNNEWTEPESGVTFMLPDQVSIENTPASTTTMEVEEFKTFGDYVSFNQHQHSSGFNLGFVSFSHGDGAGYTKQVLQNTDVTMYMTRHLVAQYKMEMWGADVMRYMLKAPANQQGSQSGTNLAADMGALPKQLQSTDDSIAFKNFIDKYGTHYVEDAFFGGSLELLINVNNSAIATHGSSWAEHYSHIGFGLIFVNFGFSNMYNKSQGMLDTDFASNSELVVRSFGGDPALVNKGSFKEWSPSVHLQPAPINATYRPLAALMSDSSVAAAMVQATEQYVKVDYPRDVFCANPPGLAVPGKDINNGGRRLRGGAEPVGEFRISMMEIQRRALEMLAEEEAKAAAPADERPEAAAPAPTPAPRATSADIVPPIPGVYSGIGNGFDGMTGEYKLPVAALGYTQAKQWYDPVAAKYWSVPDELTFESVPSACIVEQQLSITKDSDAWTNLVTSSGFNVGLMIPIYAVDLTIGVSYQHERAQYAHTTKNYSWALTQLNRRLITYRMDFGNSNLHLSPILAKAVAALPDTYSPAYDQIIQYWGTHYVAAAEFGGACNFTLTYDQTLDKTESKTYVQTNIGFSIGVMYADLGVSLDLGFGYGSGKGKVDSKFASMSTSHYNCVGGDSTLWTAGKYDDWVQSIRNAPGLIPDTMQVRPIHNMIADPTKREVMRQAILKYLQIKA